jgi:hypothetical protein
MANIRDELSLAYNACRNRGVWEPLPDRPGRTLPLPHTPATPRHATPTPDQPAGSALRPTPPAHHPEHREVSHRRNLLKWFCRPCAPYLRETNNCPANVSIALHSAHQRPAGTLYRLRLDTDKTHPNSCLLLALMFWGRL